MYFWDVLGGVEHIHTLLILLSKISFTFLFSSFFFLHNQQIFVLQYILNILLSNLFLVQGHFTLQEMFYLYKNTYFTYSIAEACLISHPMCCFVDRRVDIIFVILRVKLHRVNKFFVNGYRIFNARNSSRNDSWLWSRHENASQYLHRLAHPWDNFNVLTG